jgi:hypothetical protein
MNDGNDDDWDDADDLSALDYPAAAPPDDDHDSDLDALDAFEAPEDSADPSSLDALDSYGAVEPKAAEPAVTEHDAQPIPLIPATNPPGTVTVTAYVNGMVHRVDLAPGAAAKTEAELAEEICVVANVASKKATSAMHIFGVELLAAQGIDRDTATAFITENMPYATPAQARAAEAGLAARYAEGG